MRSPTFILGSAAPLRLLYRKNLRGPNFTLGVLHPETPLAEKLPFPLSALDPI